jgi:hypothetical protein
MNTLLSNLSTEELREISGGAPSKDTSLAYDIFYLIGAGAKKIYIVFTTEDNYEGGYNYAKTGN